jgi:ribonuclease J
LAAPPVPGHELIASNTLNQVYRTGANIFSISSKMINGMHGHKEDINMMINLLKPRFFIPVKGDYTSMLANANIAINQGYSHNNVFLLKNGEVLSLLPHEQYKKEAVIPTDNVLVSGLGVGSLKEQAVSERQRLGNDGAIVISVLLDIEKSQLVSIKTDSIGTSIANEEEVLNKLVALFKKMIDHNFKTFALPWAKLEIIFYEHSARFIKQLCKQEPIIIPCLIPYNR